VRERKYRVVKVHDGYSLQYRRWGRWVTTCGFDRGARGYYNYQRDRSGNPFFPVKWTLVEIERERERPKLSRHSIRQAKFLGVLYNPRKPKVQQVYSVNDIRAALARWFAEGHNENDGVLASFPPMSYIGGPM